MSGDDTRVALVTGGNRGIGLAIAQRLSSTGHRVAITCRGEAPAEIDGTDILAVQCDVTVAESIAPAFDEVTAALGPVGILVSNAGITRDQLTLRMTDDDFETVIDANLTGGFRVARHALKAMMRARWGRIIFVSSVAAHMGQVGQANYAASKAGLVGLARSIAREYGSRNITVNVVAPGPIHTDMLDALDETQREAIAALVPLGREGQPEEVAAAVEFLASEHATYITGAVLPVDGGMSMGR